MTVDTLADGCALAIRDAFADYHARFAQITRRARTHFETRDWAAARADAVARIALYDRCVQEISQALDGHLGTRAQDRALWNGIRDRYAALVAPLLDQELYKTFFNTLTRRFFKTRGVAADVEFVALDIEPTDRITIPVARTPTACPVPSRRPLNAVLADFPFAPGYADAAGDAQALAQAWAERTDDADTAPVLALELLQTVFYRERRAYLVGRIFQRERYMPCVIALVNGPAGVRVDALLLSRHHVAVLFGYAHAYFHADLPTVGDAVVFLRTLLPGKPLDEIYTVLGRAKQGKTERYRHFFRYFDAHPEERLRHAEGERGMVMAVFTLPGYPLVFKLIRDDFGYPKESTSEDVRNKYSLVFHHDRVGRLIDAQEYPPPAFPARALRAGAAGRAAARMRAFGQPGGRGPGRAPLLRRAPPAPAEPVRARAIRRGRAGGDPRLRPGDQGPGAQQHLPGRPAVQELRRDPAWPRGVLRYDELCLVQDCRFRALPAAAQRRGENAPRRLVPRRRCRRVPGAVPAFPGHDRAQRGALLAAHGEIFDVAWWQQLQARLRDGEVVDVPPYPEALRLRPESAPKPV
jgi:isocitrate dehydrogenase kinase/phosphatase